MTANQTIVITLIIHMQLIQPKNIIKGYYLFDGQEIPSIIEYKNLLDVNFIQKKWKKRSKSTENLSK